MDQDLGRLRARFIQAVVESALRGGWDEASRVVAAIEFRRYFNWYSDTLPEPNRTRIAERLALLERTTSREVT